MKNIFLPILFLVSTTFAQVDPPNEIKRLVADFKTTMLDCPDKIWSGYSWKGLKIVFVYPQQASSWMWDTSLNSISTLPNARLAVSELSSVYSFFKLDGKDVLSLKVDGPLDSLFELGVHEFFHGQGQAKWSVSKSALGRATIYPMSWQPRLQRRMLFDNLKNYFKSGEPRFLAQAKYWFNQWTTSYPHEAAATTDGYEGTARYVEDLASAIKVLGCQATDLQLKTSLLAEVENKYGNIFSANEFALDSEGYPMGALASLILRFDPKQSLQNWNALVSKGKTPVEILLDSVAPLEETAQPNLVQAFMGRAQTINSGWAPYLDPVILNWSDKNFIHVGLPSEWLKTNFMPYLFAYSETIKKNLSPVWAEHIFQSPDKSSEISVAKDSVLGTYTTNACPSSEYFILVPRTSVVLQNGIYLLTGESAKGRLKGVIRSNENGVQYLCP